MQQEKELEPTSLKSWLSLCPSHPLAVDLVWREYPMTLLVLSMRNCSSGKPNPASLWLDSVRAFSLSSKRPGTVTSSTTSGGQRWAGAPLAHTVLKYCPLWNSWWMSSLNLGNLLLDFSHTHLLFKILNTAHVTFWTFLSFRTTGKGEWRWGMETAKLDTASHRCLPVSACLMLQTCGVDSEHSSACMLLSLVWFHVCVLMCVHMRVGLMCMHMCVGLEGSLSSCSSGTICLVFKTLFVFLLIF